MTGRSRAATLGASVNTYSHPTARGSLAEHGARRVHRLGVIGVDSSHTRVFGTAFNRPDPDPERRVEGARVVKLWGDDRKAAGEIAAELDAEACAGPEEVCAGVDAVLVLNRNGADHPGYARLAIERGCPTFVDKPLADDLADARSIVALAHERGVPLFSCSSMRFALEVMALRQRLEALGDLRAAAVSGPAPGERLTFYLIHATEMLLSVMDGPVEAVVAMRQATHDALLLRWADGRTASVHGLREAPSAYHLVVHGSKGSDEARVTAGRSYYVNLLRQIVSWLDTGQAPVPPERTLEIIATLNAAELASRTGRPVRIQEL